jgi:AcrR family transcriptional regulator
MNQLPKSPWPAPRKRQAADFQAKRDAVIEAAARLFCQKGYENATLNEIAEALNITKPTLYYYVRDKAEILAECRTRVWDRIESAMNDATQSRRSGYDRLETFLRSYAEAISSDLGKALVMTIRATAMGKAAELESFRDALRRSTQVLERMVFDGICDGSVAPCNPRLVTFALYGALNWIAYWHDSDGSNTPAEIADAFVALFRSGLQPRKDI